MILYLDSSVLVKRYVQETGSETLSHRINNGATLFASRLSYAEIHAALGRRFRNGDLPSDSLDRSLQMFEADFENRLNILEVTRDLLAFIPELVRKYSLRAADAVHLSTALWLRLSRELPGVAENGNIPFEFAVADRSLADFARQCGLAVFNPEDPA